MKHRTLSVGFTLTLAGGLLAAALPVAAQSDSLAMLRQLAKGEWTVKYRDGSPERKVCVKSGEELIQLQHTQTNCSRFVVEDGAARVTVQYTCRGDGYGRTNIRRETGSLVQIESQGIAAGLPFQFAAEARRTGSC
ncbi:MAG: hypothetical protein SXU28_06930 [Pseudomonadota bacterium]|nr:hypothetical protein [Pseudomonadota bacterium]